MRIAIARRVLPARLGRLESCLVANHPGVHGLTVLALVLLGLAVLTGAGCEAKAEAAAQPPTAAPASAGSQLPRESDPALEAMRQAFEKNPNPYVAVVLAQQYAAAGKKNLAAQVLKTALSLPELDATSALKVASAFEALGDSKGQRLALKKADAIAPNSPDVQAQIRRLDPPGAGSQATPQDPVAAARKAFDKVPSAENGFGLFVALVSAGRLDEANNFLTQLQHMSFPAAYDYTFVGFALATAGRVSDAEALAQKAIRIDTNSIEGYLLLAQLALMQPTGSDPSRQTAFGALPADPNLPEAVAQRISDLLEASFAASLNKRATNAAETDTIEAARTSPMPVWAIMRQRPDFNQRLTTKWIPLREKREEERDPACYKLQRAVAALRAAKSLQEQETSARWARLVGIERADKGKTKTSSQELTAAAELLREAFTINRTQMLTNPAVECLLISALLNPDIEAWRTNGQIEARILLELCETPIPKHWCEDFTEGSHFIDGKIGSDILGTAAIFGIVEPKRGLPLSLTQSNSYGLSLARRIPGQPPPRAIVPAKVERMGAPDSVLQTADTAGRLIANIITSGQAEAALTKRVEQLTQALFASGRSPRLFEFTGDESLDDEAAKTMVQHAGRHLLSRVISHQSSLFLIVETACAEFELVQFDEPLQLSASREAVSEADHRNGLDWSGRLTVSYNSLGRSCRGGKWTKWRDISGEIETYRLRLEEGRWLVTWNRDTRFHQPAIRQIRDALANP